MQFRILTLKLIVWMALIPITGMGQLLDDEEDVEQVQIQDTSEIVSVEDILSAHTPQIAPENGYHENGSWVLAEPEQAQDLKASNPSDSSEKTSVSTDGTEFLKISIVPEKSEPVASHEAPPIPLDVEEIRIIRVAPKIETPETMAIRKEALDDKNLKIVLVKMKSENESKDETQGSRRPASLKKSKSKTK